MRGFAFGPTHALGDDTAHGGGLGVFSDGRGCGGIEHVLLRDPPAGSCAAEGGDVNPAFGGERLGDRCRLHQLAFVEVGQHVLLDDAAMRAGAAQDREGDFFLPGQSARARTDKYATGRPAFHGGWGRGLDGGCVGWGGGCGRDVRVGFGRGNAFAAGRGLEGRQVVGKGVVGLGYERDDGIDRQGGSFGREHLADGAREE